MFQGGHLETSLEDIHLFFLQILAGNARKVSAVWFERFNGEEGASEAKEFVTRVVPKIMKRKEMEQ